MSAVAPQAPPTSVLTRAPQRVDAWWVTPLIIVVVLGAFIVYATWAALQNANYYAEPYLSPFYSPCLAANCAHVDAAARRRLVELLAGLPDPLDSARLPATCYYYRKAYYRSFFWSPPACAVPDARARATPARPASRSSSRTSTATSSGSR